MSPPQDIGDQALLGSAQSAPSGISGIFAGGIQSAGVQEHAEKYDITNGTGELVDNMVTATRSMGGISHDDQGVFGAGEGASATCEHYDIETGVSTSDGNDLGESRYGLAGISDGSGDGVFGGGYATSWSAYTDHYVIATGVADTDYGDINVARAYLAGLSGGSGEGLFGGGMNSNPYNHQVDTYNISTAACSVIGADLSAGRRYLSGISDGSGNGVFAGGKASSGYVSTTDFYDNIGGTPSTSSGGENLSFAFQALGGISDGDGFGVFAGGANGSYNFLCCRYDITNGTETHDGDNLNSTMGAYGVTGIGVI